jgi:hypothetical protein
MFIFLMRKFEVTIPIPFGTTRFQDVVARRAIKLPLAVNKGIEPYTTQRATRLAGGPNHQIRLFTN